MPGSTQQAEVDRVGTISTEVLTGTESIVSINAYYPSALVSLNNRSEDFDAFARRQYVAKDPERNPFGVDEQPLSFLDFNIWSQICILQRFSAWVFHYPDRVRDRMQHGEQEQLQWVSYTQLN